ncbi:hypothetical protein [Streptomyces piniterrae]|uniref:hypothetical protein n=1 Tax=Streptomyces piniterrae TaxID=2571125 RepID=UPI00319E0526
MLLWRCAPGGEGRYYVTSSTPWARETFADLAGPLAEVIPVCLTRAHERARDGHQGVHTQTLEAYGHGLHAVQFEELAAGLEHLSGATAVRLQGRTVMIVADHVIYPIRYAKTDVPVTAARLRRAAGLRADLIRRHGPEPMQGELDLGLEDVTEAEVHRDLGQLPLTRSRSRRLRLLHGQRRDPA